jgi:hypothetical protein
MVRVFHIKSELVDLREVLSALLMVEWEEIPGSVLVLWLLHFVVRTEAQVEISPLVQEEVEVIPQSA